MNTTIAFNVLVLACLAVFWVREEVRRRRFARKIFETKSDLIRIVHQLKSPLSNLRKYNDFLQSKEFGMLSFAQQEAINKAQLSLEESLLLLDRLLARSRLDEEKVMAQPVQLSMRDVVQGVVDAVMPEAVKKNHRISVHGHKKIRLVTDPLLLHGILDEILSNAVHYTPLGGEIVVSITEDASSVSIEVRDTGIGISPDEAPHIFEKFFRGEKARLMHAGNGLGLPFAKQFAQKLSGDVRFASEEAKGSAFVVSLPRKRI